MCLVTEPAFTAAVLELVDQQEDVGSEEDWEKELMEEIMEMKE